MVCCKESASLILALFVFLVTFPFYHANTIQVARFIWKKKKSYCSKCNYAVVRMHGICVCASLNKVILVQCRGRIVVSFLEVRIINAYFFDLFLFFCVPF